MTRANTLLFSSILLAAVGAVLKYGVTSSAEGFDIGSIGVVLMVAGLIGFLIGLVQMFAMSDRREAAASEIHEVRREL